MEKKPTPRAVALLPVAVFLVLYRPSRENQKIEI